jgi:hypothetical protein
MSHHIRLTFGFKRNNGGPDVSPTDWQAFILNEIASRFDGFSVTEQL